MTDLHEQLRAALGGLYSTDRGYWPPWRSRVIFVRPPGDLFPCERFAHPWSKALPIV